MLAYEPSPFDPAPIPFDKLSLDVRLLGGIRDLGWTDTRPIQSGVIPLALAGGLLLGILQGILAGYLPTDSSMHALFIASGPAFRRGETVAPFRNVHVYELLCAVLGLRPAPNDGSLDSVRTLLR